MKKSIVIRIKNYVINTLVPGTVSSVMEGMGTYSTAVTSENPSVRQNRSSRCRCCEELFIEASIILLDTSLTETICQPQHQLHAQTKAQKTQSLRIIAIPKTEKMTKKKIALVELWGRESMPIS